MMSRLREILHNGRSSGVLWNLASFVVIGVSGLLINILIARFYTPDVLGSFNFTLAVFIFGGQLGAFAIQHSVLYHTPRALARAKPVGEILCSGLIFGGGLSFAVASVVFLSCPVLENFGNSSDVVSSIRLSVLGLFLFPLNKILLAYVNGKRRMVLYAAANGGRSAIIVAVLLVFALEGVNGAYIPISLSISETILFVGLVISQRDSFKAFNWASLSRWRRRHLGFGARGVLGGILFELNTRVDVFVLVFLSDMHSAGIYSMASTFAEGLFQLLIVLRYTYDPMIARLVVEGRHDQLQDLVRTGRRIGYVVMLGSGAIAIALYPWVLQILVGHHNYGESWSVFAILAGAIMLAAGYIPFTGLLQQAGHPGGQSIVIGAVMLTNLVGNLVLVPTFGVVGAAAATGFSQLAYVLFLKVMVKRRLRLSV